MIKPVYIVDYKRTPFGCFNGALCQHTAIDLAAHCIRPLLAAGIEPDLVVMGQALPAGSGQSPSTTLLLKHLQLPQNVVSYSVNKVCSSGMRAIMSACDEIQLGRHRVAIAGGTESMSCCPHLMRQGRRGCRFGEITMVDGVEWDGLVDGVSGVRMGECGDALASEFGVTRAEQDQLAQRSFERAIAHVDMVNGEIATFEHLKNDEQLSKYNAEKMRTLKPAFTPSTGTITAGNSSPLSDGAAFMLLCDEQTVKDNQLVPLAKIVGYADAVVDDPRRFPMAMVPAVERALIDAGVKKDEVGCWEMSEAFAVVPHLVSLHLGIDPVIVNKRGGAVSIGHPLGATGARLTGSVARQLRDDTAVRYGVAAVCNGGGGASAIVLERP